MALMPPAVKVNSAGYPDAGGSVIDPTWITAGSQVLGAALQSQPAGPSRAEADSGGLFNFSAPFTVRTGSGDGDASTTPAGSLWPFVAIAVAGFIAWKLIDKKKS